MKAYKKILLFFMVVLLSISSVSIMANATSVKKYDNNFSSSSWQLVFGVEDDYTVYKTFDFGGYSELAQYLSICINNIPEDFKDFLFIGISNSLTGSERTYALGFETVEDGIYYTEQIEYFEDIDNNVVIIALFYSYEITYDDLIVFDDITVDIWKWYSEPDYDLLSLLEDKGDYQGDYQEGYQDGFIAGEKSKIAKNNESFYSNIAIWIPAVITVVALASIISIFGIKKKE